ncbi:GNAT family N-acetyltransferase [Sphingobacterium sp. SGL-16]|uniref:GNAT family N-acetyltransferase n=1 Tax=Sphingobacterium sp. SGL-16 TaxID=2710883 RepID=UPI0013EB917E|nr:GNAT family protein [Sphingobacterium sp. SGL-16]NGM73065.1 GNAT family N-acetyltransferase [Sphingobacterium sp. SGL-16]
MKVAKLDYEHLSERYIWLNHPDVFKHMNISYPITMTDINSWYNRVVNNTNRIDLVFIENDEIVSMTGLTNIDLENGLIEFYIMVNPFHQGKGFGLKSTEYTINYCFANYNIRKIYLYTNSLNNRANNLYLKLGFKHEGTLRKHKFKNGEYLDRNIFGLLKEDWKNQKYFNVNINLNI